MALQKNTRNSWLPTCRHFKRWRVGEGRNGSRHLFWIVSCGAWSAYAVTATQPPRDPTPLMRFMLSRTSAPSSSCDSDTARSHRGNDER
eukprot:3260593-Prymnesium_polylepis.2